MSSQTGVAVLLFMGALVQRQLPKLQPTLGSTAFLSLNVPCGTLMEREHKRRVTMAEAGTEWHSRVPTEWFCPT